MGRLLRRKRIAAPSPEDGGFWQVPERFNFARDVVEAFAADPHRPALTFVDSIGAIDRRTFKEVAGEASRWAALLRSRGLAPGDRLLVLLGKVPAWPAVLLGALKAGLVPVPCAESLRARELELRVAHAGARLVVTDRARAPRLAERGMLVDVVVVEEVVAELRGLPVDAPTHDTASSEIALILYTSGTTKAPKGATHTHAYTWATRLQAEHWLDARPDDLVWCTAETGSAKSIWNVLLGPWSQGAEIVMHEGGFDPEQRFELVQRLGVTVLCQTPAEYRVMAEHPSIGHFDLGRLRHAVCAGEPLDPHAIEVFRDAFGVTVREGYGQTESTILVANAPGRRLKPGSMGLPMPGHVVAVIDDDGREQRPGIEGDIAVRGRPPSLFLGYWNAPDETSAVFREPWYITGDRAKRDEEGYFWFAGRADDVILNAAHRVGPFAVESALLEHPAVAQSAVIGKPDAAGGEIVKAFVVLRPGVKPSDELVLALQDRVKAVTAPHKVTREIEFVPRLPTAASGKIRKDELRERERTTGGAVHSDAPPPEAAEAVQEGDQGLPEEAQATAEEACRDAGERQRAAEAKAKADEQQRKQEEKRHNDETKAAAEQARRDQAEARRAAEAKAKADEQQRKQEEKRHNEETKAAAERARRDAEERRHAERKAEEERRAAEAERRDAAKRARKEARGLRRADSERPAAPVASSPDGSGEGHEPENGRNEQLISRLSAYGRRQDSDGPDPPAE